jgi:2-C-methyl-D-erythritol 2,4-cyclodiphosphate synthase
VDSRLFLQHALELAGEHGLVPSTCDLTIIGERPRIAPHREAMRQSLAELLGIPLQCTSVKATTTEGLGCTGRGEGLAALAVVVMCRQDEL